MGKEYFKSFFSAFLHESVYNKKNWWYPIFAKMWKNEIALAKLGSGTSDPGFLSSNNSFNIFRNFI